MPDRILKDAFAELRSLANKRIWDESDRKKLLNLAKQAHRSNPERYAEQWQPYLMGFSHHWRQTFSEVKGIENARLIHDLLPFARLSITPTVKDLETLASVPEELRAQITELGLASHRVTHEQIASIVRGPYPANITRVNLRASGLEPAHLEPLLGWLDLEKVEHLELGQNRLLGEVVIDLLSRTEAPHHLRYLGLERTALSDESCVKLAALRWSVLDELHLDDNAFRDDGAIALANSDGFPNLRILRCSGMYRSNAAISLATSSAFPNLEAIRLSIRWRLTDDEMAIVENALALRGVKLL